MHIPGFETRTVEVAPGVALRAETAGEGTPVVLLHGFPQTRHMWRHVATDLARDHRVLVPDLRGYGESAKPAATTPDVYAKRTMAADVVALADAVDVDRFVLVGHDRGALVAFRAALDHPDRVSHLGILDVVPTLDTWAVLHGVDATPARWVELTVLVMPAASLRSTWTISRVPPASSIAALAPSHRASRPWLPTSWCTHSTWVAPASARRAPAASPAMNSSWPTWVIAPISW